MLLFKNNEGIDAQFQPFPSSKKVTTTGILSGFAQMYAFIHNVKMIAINRSIIMS